MSLNGASRVSSSMGHLESGCVFVPPENSNRRPESVSNVAQASKGFIDCIPVFTNPLSEKHWTWTPYKFWYIWIQLLTVFTIYFVPFDIAFSEHPGAAPLLDQWACLPWVHSPASGVLACTERWSGGKDRTNVPMHGHATNRGGDKSVNARRMHLWTGSAGVSPAVITSF
jgi:hypothetical protein